MHMHKALWVVAVVGASLVAIASASADGRGHFMTSQPPMLTPVAQGSTVIPIITVGETLPGGYRFEAIPDGISFRSVGFFPTTVDVWVNHETSTVPFPYTPSAPTEANSQNDFDNSQVSHLVLDRRSAAVMSGTYAITSDQNYQRFCSNFLAGRAQGFERPLLFTNEEGIDWVKRTGKAFPATIGAPDSRQIGTAVAIDPATDEDRAIWGMGRLNHENSVAVPGYGHPVVLTTDDSFVTTPAQSQLYNYIAPSADAVWNDQGDLWAFVSDTPGVKNYYDIAPNSGTEVKGHFIKVPKDIATGKNPDGSELMAEDKGYPEPPNNGSWQSDLRRPAPPSPLAVGIDGPQWVLEYWSDINNVFQFVRVEDIAYDKRRGMENVVYVVDSGRGRTDAQSLDTNFRSTNGRVWKMVLDRKDPKKVNSLTVLVEGDDNPVKTPTEIHQPDNIESTRSGLLITEDPGSSQQYTLSPTPPHIPFPADDRATTARLWFVPFAGTPEIVARVDQSADGGPTDVDERAPGNWGTWESSGIVDAAKAFGRGAFLIDVQAHTLWIEKRPGDDNFGPNGGPPDGQPDFTYKREGGQLLLIQLPKRTYK